MPGERVTIEISYVETLKYEDGAYEFVFPMTVAPRYIPANSDAQDAANIAPPLAAVARRARHLDRGRSQCRRADRSDAFGFASRSTR